MTVPPSPSEEDRRRISRERAALLRERIRHTNRIRGLLFGQGITNYNPPISKKQFHASAMGGINFLRHVTHRRIIPRSDRASLWRVARRTAAGAQLGGT
jgi:transposase